MFRWLVWSSFANPGDEGEFCGCKWTMYGFFVEPNTAGKVCNPTLACALCVCVCAMSCGCPKIREEAMAFMDNSKPESDRRVERDREQIAKFPTPNKDVEPSRGTFLLTNCVVIIPKFLIAGALMTAGVGFLRSSVGTADVILNTLALGFVLEIDEAIFKVTVGTLAISSLKELNSRSLWPYFVPDKPWPLMVFGRITRVLFIIVLLYMFCRCW